MLFKEKKRFSIFFFKSNVSNFNKEKFIHEILQIEKNVFEKRNDPPILKSSLENFLQNEKNKIICLVHRKNLKIISYIIYSTVLDESEILRIGTDKNFQGKNLTYNFFLIFLKILSEKNKIKFFFLEVDELNFVAINFYKKAGFFKYNERRNYYSKNGKHSSAILMKKIM